MKAAELMIGDWVECVDSTHKKKVYAQIDAIEEGQTCILVRLDNCDWFLDISFIKPISIKPKILEKNGFKRNETHISTDFELVMDGADIFIIIFDDGDTVVDIEKNLKDDVAGANRLHHCEIKYIHQLQQAMRLCGISKEIEL